MDSFSVSGTIIDVVSSRFYKGTLHITNGVITNITEQEDVPAVFIMPGFTDAHIHIESSMLVPSEFARLATLHGTVAVVSDPHEIANVAGLDGIKFMVENAKQSPLKFSFGAPSCVPATPFETAGAVITPEVIEMLFNQGLANHLSEMMNFPGVLSRDPEVMRKLQLAKQFNLPADGHAPGLQGNDAETYASAGITTDHECFTLQEAYDKIEAGMHILIREGSAAKNYEELIDLLRTHPEKVMFCSDDLHADHLHKGHINLLVKRALDAGYDVFNVLRACSLNPTRHYSTGAGLLQIGDAADFVIVDNLQDFNVLQTYIDGKLVSEKGKALIQPIHINGPQNFFINRVHTESLKIPVTGSTLRIIKVSEGQLITEEYLASPTLENGFAIPDAARDIALLVVVNRYCEAEPAKAFVHGFGLKDGALASSVAHDSHNIIAVGTNAHYIQQAISLIQEHKGGIAVVTADNKLILPLQIGGLMANEDAFKVAQQIELLQEKALETGSLLHSPFMTLSFLSLLVIPHIKLSDKGLFDGDNFSFTTLFQ
jgi:adenine deaminase